MSVSKSAMMGGSKLVGYVGPIGETATGARAERIEYIPMLRRATALGLWSNATILTRCAGLQTNRSKSVQAHGSMDVHAVRNLPC